MKFRYLIIFAFGIFTMLSCGNKKEHVSQNTFETFVKTSQVLDLSQTKGEGVFSIEKQEFIPDSNGVLAQLTLKLPDYQKGVYYRPFSYKLASGNRMEALWFNEVTELAEYKSVKPREDSNTELGAFILLKKDNGNYLALLPIVSSTVGNTFSVTKDGFQLNLATYGTDSLNTTAPLFAYAESSNPYEATHKAWGLAKEIDGVKGNFNWRSDKVFPEPYSYLGWCTWEHYKHNISEGIILEAINDIKSSNLPIRWVLVDDGYLDADKGQLLSFGVDENKFPNGWKPITDQKDEKIKWMGIWRNFNGYMGGVSPDNTMIDLKDDFNETFTKVRNNTTLMTKNTPESANAFYDKMTTDSQENGFDIIKVDFQSDNWFYNRGSSNTIQGVHYNNRALEENIKDKGLYLLNCIAMQNFNVFNQTYSNVIRSSVDYKIDLDRIDLTIVQNFTNAFWLGHVHWLDQDMFHTSFKETARLMAVSRAVSGGPIYLSDETKNIDDTYLKPLMYADGKILGTLAPGVPLPESMMHDPYVGKKAFRVIAPLKNKSAAIMAVNLNRDMVLESEVTINDYPNAAGMIQPYEGLWGIPKKGLLLYDVYDKKATKLEEKYTFNLKTREERLFQLSPIENGWSVIGRSEKYLPAMTIDIVSTTSAKVVIKMIEKGSLLLWNQDKTPFSEYFEFSDLGDGLWEGKLVKDSETGEYIIHTIY